MAVRAAHHQQVREHATAPYPAFDGTQPCARRNAELFFPHASSSIPPAAKEACAACPFLEDCLAYALTHLEAGIWAGTTEDQRHHLRARYGIKAITPTGLVTLRDRVIDLDRAGSSRLDIAVQLGLTVDRVDHYLRGHA
jgi:hypothetical protein